MTVVDGERDAQERYFPPTAARAAAQGGKNARVGAHLAGLAVLLLLLMPLVGTGSSFSADEGAAIVQAQSLSRGDGWIVEHPMPEVDPTGVAYPLENSEVGEKGRAPFAKHPLYALMLAGADRVAGVTGMVMLSLAGTVMAAGLAALLARRLDPGLARPTLWVVGVGSPLLFDGFLVMAHTLAAAAAAGAVVLALRAVERRSAFAALAVVPVVVTGVLLRSEFLLFAVALAAGALLVGVLQRQVAIPALVAGATLVAAAGARLVEHAWVASIVGPPAGPGAPTLSSGGVGGRVRGFTLTWLTAGYGDLRPAHLALVTMLVVGILAAYVVRRRLPGAGGAVVGLCVIAAGAAVLALVLRPANVVPGLLVAFPLVAVGLVLVRRETLRTPAAQLCFGTFVMFAVAVAATQYERGGSGEWGGRYFALGLPVLAPVLLLAVRDGGRCLAPSTRRIGVASIGACTVALSVMGLAALRDSHERNAEMNQAVAELAADIATVDPPVVVAADGALARLGWPLFDDGRWLLAAPDPSALAVRLSDAGVNELVYVARSGAELPPGLSLIEEKTGAGWTALLVSTR